jgi:hypothetical protein
VTAREHENYAELESYNTRRVIVTQGLKDMHKTQEGELARGPESSPRARVSMRKKNKIAGKKETLEGDKWPLLSRAGE